MKLVWVFIFLIFVGSCGQKSSTPADFVMTLGANSTSGSSAFGGGIVLMGSNGSEYFSTGIAPQDIDNFSLELANGDWSFRAVGWLNETSEGVMSGESRCGVAQAEIQGSDTLVKLEMSQDQCSNGSFADAGAFDTSAGPGVVQFKAVTFHSCLNPIAHPNDGTPCDASTPQLMPGEAASLRVIFPARSNFSNAVKPLHSACLRLDAASAPTPNLMNGTFSTTVRLPYGGSRPLPWAIRTYETTNCQKINTTYALPQGLGQTPAGALEHLLYTGDTTSTHVTMADNFVGKIGSPFDGATNLKLPKISCGRDCLPAIFKPLVPGYHRDRIKKIVWRNLGNSTAVPIEDVQASSPANWNVTLSDTQDVIFTSDGIGSAGDNMTLRLTDSLGADPPEMSCGADLPNIIELVYDSTQHSPDEIVQAASGCPFMEALNLSNATFFAPTAGDYPPDFLGAATSVPTRRQVGHLQRVYRLMYGPIGAILHHSGIEDEALLCSSTGSFSLQLPEGSVAVELTGDTALSFPNFSTAGTFEKKIVTYKNGSPESAYFFNCSANQAVGAFADRKTISNGETRYEQVLWDISVAGEEWVETAKIQGDQRDFFLFNGEAGGERNIWAMESNSNNQYKATARVSLNSLYTQPTSDSVVGTFTSNGTGIDQHWTLDDNAYIGNVNPGNTIDPPFAAPNSFAGFALDDLAQDSFISLGE